MKKKILSALIATMVVGSVTAMAAPAEIEEGKWDVTIGSSFSPNTEDNGYDVDGESGLYGNITYGMDDQWAIQYDYSHYGYGERGWSADGDASEVNVLYKLSPNLNAYAGYVYYGENYDGEGYHTDGVQIGLQGWYPIADKVDLFGKIGLGNNNQVYELGATYEFADDWGLDVSYRWAEYKDIGDMADVQFDGVRAGISTTF
ncbi:MAG: outer membrane beta-barrel protein [Selenomonadales bacterium]|nr:outer membrane beta-barrel protein [Selenomonadales bacterium]